MNIDKHMHFMCYFIMRIHLLNVRMPHPTHSAAETTAPSAGTRQLLDVLLYFEWDPASKGLALVSAPATRILRPLGI